MPQQQAAAPDFETLRHHMIEQQIRPWDVLDERVLDVIRNTPREDFVPERYRNSLAFADITLPLGHDQVMLQPRIEARMLQSLDVQPGDRILEIGTGSGYTTACLARLGQSVLSLDIFADFKYAAQRRLSALGITNVELRVEDAGGGWHPDAGFDVIALTGSLPCLHRGFHDSLAIGGRLFVVVGRPPVMEALLITRTDTDQWARESLFETSIPPLLNVPEPPAFRF